jgi:hypothetical protein
MKKDVSLVIKSQGGKSGTRMQWTAFGDNIISFTDGIGYKTSQEKDTSKPKIANAVSGMPTVFARANLFTNALLTGNTEAKNFGMNQFYAQLLDEWKGFIAAFVLEDNKSLWKVKRVCLNYSDGDGTINTTKNPYEPKGAFGNSLFNRKQLWEDPSQINSVDRIPKPFIDIIYFNGKVVGGTSPESLVFTSPGYEFQGEDLKKAFISETEKKFTDPLNDADKLSPQKLSELYNYLTKLGQKYKSFFDKYEQSRKLFPSLVYERVSDVINSWQKEIFEHAEKNNIELLPSAKPEVTFFELDPFKSLFNAINAYYANFQGSIFTEDDTRDSECIEFKLEELLLDPQNTEIARIAVDNVDNLPINLLKDQKTGAFFTIPLSPLGLKIFQREGKLEELIGIQSRKNSSLLTVESKPNSSGKPTLDVTLNLKKDDGTDLPPWTVSYNIAIKTVDPYETNQLAVWPNFASSYWKKYYLYSEMPHDQPTGWQVYPIVGNINNTDNVVELIDKELALKLGIKKILPENDYDFVRIAEKTEYNDEIGKILVGNIKTLSNFKYEIYESNKPFRGIELRNSGKSSGYIFLKYSGDQSNNAHIQFIKDKRPEGCRVGIDFGSNNTCVAFDNSGNSELLTFNNRRISFFKSDDEQNDTNKSLPADTFEMLFFQNEQIDSNKVKSVLTIHDQSRMVNTGKSVEDLYAEVVKGGFTLYEKNVNVIDSTDSMHIVEIPRLKDQKVNIVHSMKWKEKDANHKIAFLKNLLLQTYAELFAGITGKTLFPNEVFWAYPAAMSDSRVQEYRNAVWTKLKDCNPLNGLEYKFIVAENWAQKKVKETGLGGNSGSNTSSGGMFDDITSSPNNSGGMFNDNTGSSNSGGGGMFDNSSNTFNPSKTGVSSSKFIPARYPEEIEPENAWLFSAPIPIKNENVLTESQAVAKYAVSIDPLSEGQYKVGVDVGGSTSDILFITGIKGDNVLVKQNSIKVAAGMLAEATKYIPDFCNFLKNYASRNEEILGGKIKAIEVINERTTAYCFNLILDRLEDEEHLNQFYNEIASRCKPLFWVNMYITGLTIYYLGIVTRKVGEISHKNANPNGDGFGKGMNRVIVDFYGKGSRIFDWFKACNKETAEEYIYACFNKGFGKDVRSFVTFKNFEDLPMNTKDVKSEVAKGLANSISSLAEFDSAKMIGEISGEDGYVLQIPGKGLIPYTATMEINPSLIQRLGSELSPSFGEGIPYPRFTDFMNTFYDYAKNYADFKHSGHEMLQAIKNMNILRDIQNDDDYKKAKTEKEFDFVAPLLILEGQAFLKSYLLPKIKSGK